MFLQKTLVVVLAWLAPKGVYLEERVTWLAVGVFGVIRQHIAPRFSVEQEVNGVPLSW